MTDIAIVGGGTVDASPAAAAFDTLVQA